MDTVKVMSKDEEAAVIFTSLNPLVLWKYLELSEILAARTNELTEADIELLSKEVAELPEPLLAVYAFGERTSQYQELGFSNRAGALPVYRTTEAELSDISERSLGTSAVKLAALYPPVRENLRIMLVDPVSTRNASMAIRKLIAEHRFKQATIIVAKTDNSMDKPALSSFDPILEELVYENKAAIEILKASTAERIRGYLEKKPVHLLALAGERSKNIELIESEGTRLHP
ncbi:hypothetical protein N6H14_14755 [Paenibacillus sp. CC-CFT747]|nr:hypothetical protein N6H14_14755 [Paenibacillus sp. CC-CFT747]